MYIPYDRSREFGALLGCVLTTVGVGKFEYGDAVFFETTDGRKFVMYHDKDCCENVNIEEVVGNLADLVNDGPVLLAEETSNQKTDGEYGDSATWTFYKLRTHNGDVTIRWLGSSNGYYSESVDFYEITDLDFNG